MDKSSCVRLDIDGFGVYGFARGLTLAQFLSELESFTGFFGEYDLSAIPTTVRVGQWPLVSGTRVRMPDGSPRGPFSPAVSSDYLGLIRGFHASLVQCPGSGSARKPADATPRSPSSLRSPKLVPALEALESAGARYTRRTEALEADVAGSGNRIKFGVRSLKRCAHVGSVRISTHQDCVPGAKVFAARRARLRAGFGTFAAYCWGVPLRDGLLINLRPDQAPTTRTSGGEWQQIEFRGAGSRFLEQSVVSLKANPSDSTPVQRTRQFQQVLVSALVPLAISVVLAVVMKQPMFLLFALAGPIVALLQHTLRSPSSIELPPGWLARALRGVDDFDAACVIAYAAQWGKGVEIAQSGQPRNLTSLSSVARSLCFDRLAGGSRPRIDASASPTGPSGPHRPFPDTAESTEQPPILILPRVNTHLWSPLAWVGGQVFLYDDYSSYVSLLRSSGIRDSLARVYHFGWDGTVLRDHRLPSQCFRHKPLRCLPEGKGITDGSSILLRSIAGYVDTLASDSALPQVVPFGECPALQHSKPQNSWREFLIDLGVGSQGNHRIDLSSVGPHMLVAGTTGAGKSEFLQSLIFAACARYSPSELQLVLYDYKGGAGLGRAHGLSHSLGLVTDLDPHEVTRSLDGLRAELKNREHLFVQQGVVGLVQYNEKVEPKQALPRILIVVDEFRALTDDHPEFVSHLVRIAAIGRSLGIHLVLATQRPAGVISAEIRANISYKVCLRVSDEQDSLDVLGDKAAAHLSSRAPGRFLARADSGPISTSQAYYLDGTSSSSSVRSALVDRWHQPLRPVSEPDGAPASDLVSQLSRAFPKKQIAQRKAVKSLWAPALPKTFAGTSDDSISDAIAPKRATSTALVALTGRPAFLELSWLEYPGHLHVSGPALSGRTSTLITCAQAPHSEPLTPLRSRDQDKNRSTQQSDSQQMPLRVHWIGTPTEASSVTTAVTNAGNVITNYIDVSNAYLCHALLVALSATETSLSGHLLVIDDLELLRTTLENYDRGSGVGLLEGVLRSAQRTGLRAVASTLRNVPLAFQSYFSQRIVLASGNSETDTAQGVPRHLLPMVHVPGRGAWLQGPTQSHCQIREPHALLENTKNDSVSAVTTLETLQDGPHEALKVRELGTIACTSKTNQHTPNGQLSLVTGLVQPRKLGFSDFASCLIVGREPQQRLQIFWALTGMRVPAIASPHQDDALAQHNIAYVNLEDHNTQTHLTQVSASLDDNALDYVHFENAGSANAQAYAEQVQKIITRGLEIGVCVTGSCAPNELTQAYRGPLAALRELGTGILVQPHQAFDREFLGVSLATAIDPATYSGKAVFVQNFQAHSARLVHE